MHPIFLLKESNLWREPKRLLVYCSCSFTIFQTRSSPPSGQDGRTSMLLEQRARGGFTRMLWCTKKALMFFSTFKKYIRSWEKAGRRWSLEGWPWLGVKMTLSNGLHTEHFMKSSIKFRPWHHLLFLAGKLDPGSQLLLMTTMMMCLGILFKKLWHHIGSCVVSQVDIWHLQRYGKLPLLTAPHLTPQSQYFLWRSGHQVHCRHINRQPWGSCYPRASRAGACLQNFSFYLGTFLKPYSLLSIWPSEILWRGGPSRRIQQCSLSVAYSRAWKLST